MVRLIHIKIPQAVSACLNMAAKIEVDLKRVPRGVQHDNHREVLRGHMGHYMRLAEDIEGLKYLSYGQVNHLIATNSFLKEFVQ